MKYINYRRGGLVMLPFVTAGLAIAYIVNAPDIALASIGLTGYVTAAVLIALGKKAKAVDRS